MPLTIMQLIANILKSPRDFFINLYTKKQLNQWLQKYQIEINLKRTNVLVGKEKDIRIFFMMLFGTITLKGIGRCTRLLKEVHSLFRRLKHSVSFNTTQDFTKDLIFSAVILARWKEGFYQRNFRGGRSDC